MKCFRKTTSIFVLSFVFIVLCSSQSYADVSKPAFDALMVNDARNDNTGLSGCTDDVKIGRYLKISELNPLILSWPLPCKISEYKTNNQDTFYRVFLGFGSRWVNDEGLNKNGGLNGDSHYCWQTEI